MAAPAGCHPSDPIIRGASVPVLSGPLSREVRAGKSFVFPILSVAEGEQA